jgi:cell division protein FtsL
MSLIIFLVVGLIAGALASYILGRQQDLLVNLLIGIIGAVVGGLLAGVTFAYAWQHFQCVQMGYQIESLKAQQAQMTELNRQLTLEAASLRSPARIDEIARRQLGLTAPAAEQLHRFEVPSDPILAEMRPAEASRAR